MPLETYLGILIYFNFTDNKDVEVNSLSRVNPFFLLLYLKPYSVYSFLSKLISLVHTKLAIKATLASIYIMYYTILKLLI